MNEGVHSHCRVVIDRLFTASIRPTLKSALNLVIASFCNSFSATDAQKQRSDELESMVFGAWAELILANTMVLP
jgi:hypothetical protein